jgi:hypothetical protein
VDWLRVYMVCTFTPSLPCPTFFPSLGRSTPSLLISYRPCDPYLVEMSANAHLGIVQISFKTGDIVRANCCLTEAISVSIDYPRQRASCCRSARRSSSSLLLSSVRRWEGVYAAGKSDEGRE